MKENRSDPLSVSHTESKATEDLASAEISRTPNSSSSSSTPKLCQPCVQRPNNSPLLAPPEPLVPASLPRSVPLASDTHAGPPHLSLSLSAPRSGSCSPVTASAAALVARCSVCPLAVAVECSNMAGKDENGVKGFQFRKPVNRGKWETFRKAVYDSSTGQFLGRTGKSWAQLLTFYTIFYIVLAALFAICMQGLLATLDERSPKWKLNNSLIGSNPGLGFRPISDRTEEGSLIWYNVTDHSSGRKWVKLLDKFLEPYQVEQTGGRFQQCDFNKTADEDHVCTVNLENFGPCSPSNNYGYFSSSPCVFLKLNKIYGWEPTYYTETSDEMPKDLQGYINLNKTVGQELVWISCEGSRPVDKEHLQSFEYYPHRGFPSFYFPYTNVPNYLSPLIAVQIVQPQAHVVISIECRAWAKNINYNPSELEREGSVKFEILQD